MKQNLKVYFYGGSQEIQNRTEIYITEKYPKLNAVGFYSPPFRPLTKVEEEEIINNINSKEANLVFVALGCPKQEKWMASMKGRINGTDEK